MGAGLALITSLASVVAAISIPQEAPQLPKATNEQAEFFESKVRPILVANCYSCHAGQSHSGALKLDDPKRIARGGQSGAVFVAGDPDKSLLIQAIDQTGNLKMPPGGRKLSEVDIATLKTWIQMGAPWPEHLKDIKPLEPWWSLQPVKMPPLPNTKHSDWPLNAIDRFVLSKLETKGLNPMPPADRRALIRRVTYDLTGLPPTYAEVQAFLTDTSKDAYGKVVDRLLSSPHYGERSARHWMDVARYADTKGYVFNEDRNYPNAYTYRDWLINAFNQDLPYNQFIKMQLAADRVLGIETSDDKRSLAALGYLTLGRRFINNTQDIIDDRIDVTMRGFQGLTVGCARCHDHKFDPIPTQDYYSLYAIFNSCQEVSPPISEKSISEPWLAYQKKVNDLEGKVKTESLTATQELRKALKDSGNAASIKPEIKQSLQALREDQVPEGAELNKLLPAFPPDKREQIESDRSKLNSLKQNAPPMPEFAHAVQDKDQCSDGVVFKRGNPGNPGEPAPRRFLQALSPTNQEREHWTKGSGRLELADAIASKSNPLTARVYVNRVWQDHFGQGIVRTPSDFGHQGEKPTDPELLDFLAAWFMEHNWSIKKLHRLIVTSATYRESSAASSALLMADPDNRLWGRMNRRRLDLEQTRDSLVNASGRLELNKVGGKSVDLWAKPFTPRRAVYGFIERQNLPGIFKTFDFASPDSHNAKRFQTTVPQQALFFMNSAFAVDQARSFCARQEIQSARDNAQCIRRLYMLLLQRLPDSTELAAGLGYLGTERSSAVAQPEAEWRYGFGGYDEKEQHTKFFTPLDFYAENGYRVGATFPDPKLGYLVLNGVGGHPGHDGDHAAIRRWVAPDDLTIRISGQLKHGQKEGDGVRARVISSRSGLIGEWVAHNSSASTRTDQLSVKRGDTIDFAVDPITNDGYDSFQWIPVIETKDGRRRWDANREFVPPPDPPMTKLALYAQALMMTNEFMFVD